MEQGGTPNFELPREQPEAAPEHGEGQQEQSVERTPAHPEKPAQATKQPVLPALPDDIPAADVPDITASDDTVHPTDTPQLTKDSDHIEPEWVDKAKAVIAQTKNDPYQQKHEMSKVKADYIRKRFGKDIKTDEAAA